jgi:hypothetical protein
VQGNLTTNLTAGSVPFIGASGLLSQDNTNLFWDNTNKRLGVGTNAPNTALHVVSSVVAIRATLPNGDGAIFSNDSTTSYFQALTSGDLVRKFNIAGLDIAFRSGSSSYTQNMLLSSNGNLIIQNGGTFTDAGFRLDVNGTARVQGNLNVSTGGITLTGAQTIQTSTGNLTLATAAGNGNILLTPNGTGGVGINTASVIASLDIRVKGSGGSASNASNSIIISPETIADITEGEIGSQIILNAKRNGVSDGVSIASVMSTANFDLASMAFYTHSNSSGTPRVESMRIFGGAGNVLIQNGGTFTDAGFRLDVNGTARVSGNLIANSSVGIGTTSLTGFSLYVLKNITGATNSYGIAQGGVVQSDVTNSANGYLNNATTAAASFTLTTYRHFWANQGSIGAGSSITSQYGFLAGNTLIGATNNYGFYGDIPSGTNRWNLYMNGTADNYLAGNLGIGTTSSTAKLDVRSSATSGSSASPTFRAFGQDADSYFEVNNNASNSADIKLTRSDTTLMFSVNGHTGLSYLFGQLGIGNLSPNASAKLQVDSTTQGFLPPRMTAAQRTAIASPAEGLIVYQTDSVIGLYIYANATWRTLGMI